MNTGRRSVPSLVLLLLVALLSGSTVWTLSTLHSVSGAAPAITVEQKSHSMTANSLSLPLLSGNGNAITIMPLGDSITAGTNSSYHAGYRLPLWEASETAGWHIVFVGSQKFGPGDWSAQENEGHSGWRIDQLSAHVVGWLETYHPDIILLQIGTNDILQGFSHQVIVSRLNKLIDQITGTLPHSILLIAQITPLGNRSMNEKVIAYNHTIPTLVRKRTTEGKLVRYVDMYDAVPVRDISDSIHPDNQGYTLMSQVWFRALSEVLS